MFYDFSARNANHPSAVDHPSDHKYVDLDEAAVASCADLKLNKLAPACQTVPDTFVGPIKQT